MDKKIIETTANPAYAQIDESELLPGIADSRTASGTLMPNNNTPYTFKFSPLDHQDDLLALSLHSKGIALHYTLANDGKLLTAFAGENGPTVFTALIDHGNYTFTLKKHIDHLPPENLITDKNWVSQAEDLPPGYPLPPHFEASSLFSTSQELFTKPNAPYQLSFFCHPHASAPGHEGIQVFWGEQLLHTLDLSSQDERGFIFSIDAPPEQDKTLLEFISIGKNNYFSDCISNVQLISTAQQSISLPFNFLIMDEDRIVAQEHFMVNVTTTPPIQLNNQDSYDIVYDQGVYQTIIMIDENPHGSPLTKLNLEPLFNQLAIPEEQRLVQVVQLQEGGVATNVYEVNVGDKNNEFSPITVADVQLSFPGGDKGLEVFHRHISIDDGEKSGGEFNI